MAAALSLLGGGGAVRADDPGAPADGEAAVLKQVLERLRDMEKANQRLAEQVQAIDQRNQSLIHQNGELLRENQDLSKKFDVLSTKLKTLEDRPAGSRSHSDRNTDEPTRKSEEAGARTGDAESGGTRRSGGATGGREPQLVGNRHLGKLPIRTRYNYEREGLQFTTEDDEFEIKLRGMMQADGRLYTGPAQDPVSSGFYIPRARFYFTGHLTRPIEYNFSFQRAYDVFNVLNAYFNFNYDSRLQFRFGRFKTPFTYEYYKLHVWQLMAPERSLFSVNYQGGRQVGAMALGDLFDRRMEYAVGMFDGPRRSYSDYNAAKDVMAFLNFTPFVDRNDSILQNLNLGGSIDFGDQNNPANPSVLRTSANASDTPLTSDEPVNNAVVPFLAFNQNVRERGLRSLWELHLAYYYRGLSLLAAWNGGFNSYGLAGAKPHSTQVPVEGYFAQAGYILTGETITDRVMIDPLHHFDLRPGRFGLGAWEVTTRFSNLEIGQQVFTQGFADPNLWTNRVNMVDVGVNWYLNKWVKVYFDWEHAMFGQPVYYRPGPFLHGTSDLFWVRLQVYF